MPSKEFLEKFYNQSKQDATASQAPTSTGSTSFSLTQLIKNHYLPNFINKPDTNVVSSPSSPAIVPDSLAVPTTKSITDSIGPDLTQSVQNAGTAALNRASTIIPAMPGQNANTIANLISGNSSDTFLQGNFLDNILNKYENVTYNFKLMMGAEDEANSDAPDLSNMVVLVQSGVTGSFYIKDVEIETVVGPNERTQNQQATLFKVSIVEPNGISFIDKVIEGALELGIKNIMRGVMFLELVFLGYDSSGQQVEINDIPKRIWRLQVTEVATSLDTQGSNYVMNFAAMGDYAFHRLNSSAAILKQELSFPVSTVGKFFDDLGYYLTLQDTRASLQGHTTRNEYIFDVDPSMRNWKIGQSPLTKNAPAMFVDNGGLISGAFKTGTTLSEIVNAVFSSTEEASRMVNPQSSPNVMGNAIRGSDVGKIPMINARNEIIGYNQNNNEYMRRYTFYINKYDAPRILIDKPVPDTDQGRAHYLFEDSLRKKYEYMFTGKNTEVLNLDIDLNLLWVHATSYYDNAVHRTRNNNSNYIKNEPQSKTQDSLRKNVGAKKNNFGSDNSDNVDASFESSLFPKNVSDLLSRAGGFLSNLTDRARRLGALQQAEDLLNKNVINSTQLAEIQREADISNSTIPVEGSAVEPNDKGFATGAINRIRNVNTQPQLETQELTIEPNNKITQLFSKQIDPALDINPYLFHFEETTLLGRSIFGVVMNNLFGNVSGNLLTIDLEIKGDPYWLGETDIEQQTRLKNRSTREQSNGLFANYLRGESSLFLTFKTPASYNEDTGFVSPQDTDIFLGVYNIIKINHMFNDGKFTQKIEAVRDMNSSAQVIKTLTGGR